ncbi:unnamed protein product [Rhizoctonia solani]|uniref:Uncharacterized protein n=1 Tax=Rhizoctonia solani TaxID=456999 RepID=A0A8H3C9K5_9AGAM|nr:unnamed protein product [Rhizoctonia solani]
MPAPTTADYFHPFASGDRPQPAPLLPSSPSAVLLYLGAGLDLYPVASHYAGYSTFLYVDAKPRLTRAPGDKDHAAWRAPEEVAKSVVDRALGALDVWELVAPEILKFQGQGGLRLYYIFATLDFELVQQAAAFPFVATLLERVEGLYVHGLYISPETNLHLPNLRTVYAIPGNASCADVDFIQEHDCTPPGPSSPYYIPTRTEQEHYERLCAWAGVNPHAVPQQPQIEYGTEADQLLEKFVGLSLTAPLKPKEPKPAKEKKGLWKAKTKESAVSVAVAAARGPPLRFVLIDQISWDENLARGTIPPPPVPSRTGFAHEIMGRPSTVLRKSNTFSTDEIKPRAQVSVDLHEPVHQKRESIPHVLPPLPPSTSTFTPASLRGYPSNSSLRKKQSLRGFPSTQSLRGLAQLQLSPAPPAIRESSEDVPRISRPKSGGGTSQGLVRCSSKRTEGVVKGGGYRVSKTVQEAEAVWEERDRKERERRREERRMRERGMDVPAPPKKNFLKFLSHGFFGLDTGEVRHAHTV